METTTSTTLKDELNEIEHRLKTILCITRKKRSDSRQRTPEYKAYKRAHMKEKYQQNKEEISQKRKEYYQNMSPEDKRRFLDKCKARRLSKLAQATKKGYETQ